MKILFVSTEAEPFAKSGGLGDVVGSLPKQLKNRKADARVILPLYKSIKRRFAGDLNFIGEITVTLSWRRQYCGLFSIEDNGILYYFVDNEQYFGRDAYYGYYDDGERFAYFSKAVLELLKIMEFKPDILHCNEWQTAMIPVYLKSVYKNDDFYRPVRSVFTIHNIEYQGKFDTAVAQDIIGLPIGDLPLIELNGMVNMMKGAIICCDRLTTVSESYSRELKDPYFAHGLDGVIRDNDFKLIGIINGIDYEKFDPATDRVIYANYNGRTIDKKLVNKAALQEQMGLRIDPDIPMIGMVGRMVAHKGMDLVKNSFTGIMEENVQFVVLGTGDEEYKHFFTHKAHEYKGKVAASIHFSTDMANKIYAASDMFLMPSKSEPCGVAQMIALRYGTIPIVRKTGGLRDSILTFDSESGTGNGITFDDYSENAMMNAIRQALDYYQEKKMWKKLVSNALRSDFSWKKSAAKYMELYKSLI